MSVSNTVFQEALDKSLKTFAEKIKVEEDDYITQGIDLCENVREVLEDDMSCLLFNSCSYFARSITVGTEPPFQVVHPDFAILLVTYPSTPLDEIEAESQDILRKHKSALEITKINTTSDIMRITFQNGVCAHLLVENTAEETDMDEFLQKIKHRGDSRPFYNAVLAFQHEELMKGQTEFTVLLARLANYWLKSKDMNYGSGVKVIFELLAIGVAADEEEDFQESMTSAFIKMAKKIENLNELQLAFATDDLSEEYCQVTVGKVVEQEQAVPYLIEPFSQLLNNLVDEFNMKREQMEVLMKTGKAMREGLEKFMEKAAFNVSVGPDGVDIDYTDMFTK